MRNLKIYKSNTHLSGKSESEITSKDIGSLNRLSSARKFYDESGRKTHSNYLIDNELVIIKNFKDIMNQDGDIIDLEVTLIWLDDLGDHLQKTWLVNLDEDNISKMKITRKTQVKQYLLKEAKSSDNPMIHEIFTLLFIWLGDELDTWINTEDASFFHTKLDNAPNEDNASVLDIFGGITNTPRSFSDLLQLPTETHTNIIGYLKYFIK